MDTAAYDAANQQLALGNKSTTFDNNGNLATLTDPNGTTTYTWNARNQLISLSGPGVTASFQYDALGRRTSKTVNGVTTEFLYDGLNTVQELSNGTPTANLLTGLGIDETLSRTDAIGARSFLADGLGSTLALTDSAGTIQTDYTYEPFGKTTLGGAASTNAFQYTGRENDGTGLYYYRARYYHPELQRFISRDPIGFAGGDVNLYGYVQEDPLNRVDPYGKNPAWVFWLFRLGIPLWRVFSPVPAYIDGLGLIKPYPGTDILMDPAPIAPDPVLGPDNQWYWPDGTPVEPSPAPSPSPEPAPGPEPDPNPSPDPAPTPPGKPCP